MKKTIAIVTAVLIAACVYAGTTTFSGSLMIRQNLSHKFEDDIGTTSTESFNSNAIWYATFGTSTGNMEDVWSSKITLTNQGSTSIDLYGGLTNRFGTKIDVSSIKWFQVACDADNHGSMKLGDGLAAWSSFLGGTNQSLTLRPGVQLMFWISGTNDYAVTDSTSDILKVTNTDAGAAWTNTVRVYIGGLVD